MFFTTNWSVGFHSEGVVLKSFMCIVRSELKHHRAGSVVIDGESIVFKGSLFRGGLSNNILLFIDKGEINFRENGSSIRLGYRLAHYRLHIIAAIMSLVTGVIVGGILYSESQAWFLPSVLAVGLIYLIFVVVNILYSAMGLRDLLNNAYNKLP